MPHIPRDRREALADLGPREWSDGDLNYILTTTIWAWVRAQGGNYQAYARAIGALECAKLELARMKLGPYEDMKASENGSAYE